MKDSCGLVRGSHSLQLTFVTRLSPGNKHTAFSWGFLLLPGFPSIPPQHCSALLRRTWVAPGANYAGPSPCWKRPSSCSSWLRAKVMSCVCLGLFLNGDGVGNMVPVSQQQAHPQLVKAAMPHTDLAGAEVLTEKDYRSREDRAEPQRPAGSRKRSLGRPQGAEDAALRPHTAPEAAAKRPNSCRAKFEFSVKLFDSGIFAVIAATLDPNTFLPT